MSSDQPDADRHNLTRDPEAYYPTRHFFERYSANHGRLSETRTNPPITGEVIDACFREGKIARRADGAVSFRADVDGTEWVLVVDPDKRAVITAWAPAHHDSEWVRQRR